MKRKSPEEKEKILKEIEKLGIVEGCRKFGISATTYYDWDRRYKSNGLSGLKNYTRHNEADVKRLVKENAQLKELLIAKELKLQMQSELIKKRMPEWKRKEK